MHWWLDILQMCLTFIDSLFHKFTNKINNKKNSNEVRLSIKKRKNCCNVQIKTTTSNSITN